MTTVSSLLASNLSSVFNQRDGKMRKLALKDLWAVDGVLWSAEGTYLGRKEVERAAAGLLRRYPEFDFALAGEIDEIPNAARVRWSFGARGSSPALTGLDVVVVASGRIVAMYRFLDGAAL